ncbi:MAG TPA: MOSC domain-containing protein [Burkholderiales bacterium]|nr:MOSC domain-containing protein [Burkholderiales bacterium]
MSILGAVAALWRYPVKSMQGEPCRSLKVDSRGVEGDRVYAVRCADGKLGSGKDTQRFRFLDGLLACGAAYDDDVPVIRLPDGGRMRADDPMVHSVLSELFGQPVSLVREDSISHLDSGSVHLVTRPAIERLKAAIPGSVIDERRFRTNVSLEIPLEAPEPDWLGSVLAIGPEVQLRVAAPTKRCRMVTMAQNDLPDDTRIRKRLGLEANACFGYYAEVLSPGTITEGDAISRVR